jgi:hypothetical protein
VDAVEEAVAVVVVVTAGAVVVDEDAVDDVNVEEELVTDVDGVDV